MTALITGGSSGMGLEYARQLAGRGYDLVLVSNRQDELDAAAETLHVQFPVNVRTRYQDLSVPDAADILFEWCTQEEDLLPDVVINNAGMFFFKELQTEDIDKVQTMIKVVLPQAIRNILPALGNEFIMILKETSLASTFFLGDLMTSQKIVVGATYLQFESLIIVGAIYLCFTFPLSKLVGWFEKRMSTEKSYKSHKRHTDRVRNMHTDKGVF